MNFMNKMERKFGRYAIPNLSLYVIICYVIGYVLQLIAPTMAYFLYLIPSEVFLHGQVWRLVTWVLIPPSSLNIFTIIMLIFYYSIGSSLERTMGSFRYNVFIFGGVLLTTLSVLLLYGIGLLLGTNLNYPYASTYYLTTSIFLAYALCYPDMQVLLYFVIPVKVKWLAILDVVLLVFECISSGFSPAGIGVKVVIGATLLNLLFFFMTSRSFHHLTPGEQKRRREFKKKVQTPGGNYITRHKCAVCGRTERDGDDLVFRFCSKCNGNYEYCQDHMYTHTHVK